jgi:hypothetical protein
MAEFHARRIAAVLFIVLLLTGGPSWATAPRRSPRTVPRASLQEQVARMVRLVLGQAFEKTGNTLDPNGGSGSHLSFPGETTTDTGNTLDPNG